MKTEVVKVDFYMRRQKKPEPDNEEQFWLCVTAKAESPDVNQILIDMYYSDESTEVSSHSSEPPLKHYPLNNGETYLWPYEPGEVIAIIVRYTLKEDTFRWLVAASGIWLSEGYYFMGGKRLKDRSALFI